jgi:hypothetical protein
VDALERMDMCQLWRRWEPGQDRRTEARPHLARVTCLAQPDQERERKDYPLLITGRSATWEFDVSKNTLIFVLIGGAAVIALISFFGRTNRSLAAQSPDLSNLFGLIPKAGPNTPVNTSGSAPYAAGGAYGAGSARGGTVGPSVIASSVSGAAGIASAIASIFNRGSAQVGTLASQPTGILQQGYNLLNAPSQNPIAPPFQPVPLPSSLVAWNTYPSLPAPPDITNPSLTPSIDLSALSTAPPSPLTSPADFGAAMNAAITNPGYSASPTFNSTPVNYASPSYPTDGGEILV